MSAVEIKLANLLVTLRESAASATQIANQIEAALLAIYEKDESVKPVKKEQPKVQFPFNQNIKDLMDGVSIKFDMSPDNITDMRDYACVEIHSNTGSTVSFTYVTASTYTKMCFMKNMIPEVMNMLEKGKIYMVHNAKRNGKNFWDFAYECTGEKYKITARAKKLAKLFAELKRDGKL